MTRRVESDDELFTALRRMWTERDPVPPDLDDSVFALIDAELIASDIALLELVEDRGRSAAVRGGSDERTLRFTDGAFQVLIRIAPAPDGARIDGWAVPATDGTVRLRLAGRTHASSAATSGRFAFTGAPDGTATLWFEPDGAETAADDAIEPASPGAVASGAWKAGPFTI